MSEAPLSPKSENDDLIREIDIARNRLAIAVVAAELCVLKSDIVVERIERNRAETNAEAEKAIQIVNRAFMLRT